MKHVESKIPQFYDLLTDELDNVKHIYDQFIKEARQAGFDEIQTTAIELRERYLKATKVHYSKIFEVHRVKESTKYALQADLAISMSRFIADLPEVTPMKLIQRGTMFRDRIPNVANWRREFQQILVGTWGGTSYYYDAEIIALSCKALNSIRATKVSYVQISNHNVFEVIYPGAVEDLRFNGLSLASIMEKGDIPVRDQLLLTRLYESSEISVAELQQAVNDCGHDEIKYELSRALQVMQYCEMLLPPQTALYFSLATLSGTGHYSGLNYKIYVSIDDGELVAIADGGRIDTLCTLINKRTVPAVCLGIGITELAQKIPCEERNRIFILVDEDQLMDKHLPMKMILQTQQELQCSIFPLKRKKWRQLFMSDFYQNCIFVTCENERVSIRLGKDVSQQFYETHLDRLNELKAALEAGLIRN